MGGSIGSRAEREDKPLPSKNDSERSSENRQGRVDSTRRLWFSPSLRTKPIHRHSGQSVIMAETRTIIGNIANDKNQPLGKIPVDEKLYSLTIR